MTTDRHPVRRATAADVDAMTAQLGRSFADDPVIGHVFRNERRRPAAMAAYFSTQMRQDYLPFGGCYTTDDHVGSAIWGPPGKPLAAGVNGLLTLLPVFPYVARHAVTTVKLLALMESMHPKVPHWYLATLGADPSVQGQGVGTALMQPVLAHCDRNGIGAYLESSKERNVPFYARHGFVVENEVPLPGGGPKIWTMWRDPRPLDESPDA